MKNHKIRPNKNSHTAKSNPERKTYGDFLNRPSEEIDDTFNDEKENFKTSDTVKDISSLKNTKDIDPELKGNRSKEKPYKSLHTQISENIKSIIFGCIVFGVISTCVTVVWQQQREMGEISEIIKSAQKDIDNIQEKYQKADNDKTILIRITELTKDLDFIKDRLQKIENKISI